MPTTRPVLVIGNARYSSWSLRPWLLLRHFEVDHETVMLPLDSNEFRQRIHEFSPSGRVPALRHGKIDVWDSLAICEYVNEIFLAGRGWPADTAARAYARAAVAEMHSGFASLRSACPMNVCRQLSKPMSLDASVQADVDRVQALWTQARRKFGSGGDFLFGAFGIADAFFAPVAARFRTYGVAASGEAAAYVDTIFALPAMRDWITMAQAETQRLEKYETVGG